MSDNHPPFELTVDSLNADVITAGDPTGQIKDICALGAHLRDALKRVDNLRAYDMSSAQSLVIAGMGGSGIGARLAVATLGSRVRKPIFVTQGYELPAWVNGDTLVLLSSYSGNTEETISCYEDAGARGAQRVVASTGGELMRRAEAEDIPTVKLPTGYQPRATVGYGTVVTLAVAEICGAGPALGEEVLAAADLIDELVHEWGPDAKPTAEAKRLAISLQGTLPVVCGADLTAPVAYRWKCQFNENSKLPSFASELPELNHNELVGWQGVDELNVPLSAIFLDDENLAPQLRKRIELTRDLVKGQATFTIRPLAKGKTNLERVMSLVLLGDLVSLYLAILRQVDPAEIEVLEKLKLALAKPLELARK